MCGQMATEILCGGTSGVCHWDASTCKPVNPPSQPVNIVTTPVASVTITIPEDTMFPATAVSAITSQLTEIASIPDFTNAAKTTGTYIGLVIINAPSGSGSDSGLSQAGIIGVSVGGAVLFGVIAAFLVVSNKKSARRRANLNMVVSQEPEESAYHPPSINSPGL
eukprot:TRINITY_DN28318_c0_g1_i1.p1 TRINITY_DN28318_c0_g1~~TRINITY_DN28318_c0_g1_i1.p1  ORF type:complete len:190 (+),score=17.90 TRINITY_DN28318_c0_g1_i1:76-570(+)